MCESVGSLRQTFDFLVPDYRFFLRFSRFCDVAILVRLSRILFPVDFICYFDITSLSFVSKSNGSGMGAVSKLHIPADLLMSPNNIFN
jgi:hypothetical protein